MTNKHIKAQEERIKRLILEIEQVLDKAVPQAVKALRDRRLSPLQAASVIGSLESELVKYGFDDVLKGIDEVYADEIKEIKRNLRNVSAGIAFTGDDIATVQALRNFDVDLVSKNISKHVSDLKGVLMRSYITGTIPEYEELRASTDRGVFRRIDAELNTSVAGLQRTITLSKADEAGIERFLYDGPLDQVTRPFCQKHVGKVYTLEELKGLDNGQGLPVEIYLGGYNCRHRLIPKA